MEFDPCCGPSGYCPACLHSALMPALPSLISSCALASPWYLQQGYSLVLCVVCPALCFLLVSANVFFVVWWEGGSHQPCLDRHLLDLIILILLYFNEQLFESLPPGWKFRKGRSAVHWCGSVTYSSNCTQCAPKICCNHKWICKFSQQRHDLRLVYHLISVYVHLLCVSTRVCVCVCASVCVCQCVCLCLLAVSVFVLVFACVRVCCFLILCVCCFLSHLK